MCERERVLISVTLGYKKRAAYMSVLADAEFGENAVVTPLLFIPFFSCSLYPGCLCINAEQWQGGKPTLWPQNTLHTGRLSQKQPHTSCRLMLNLAVLDINSVVVSLTRVIHIQLPGWLNV